MNTRSSQLFNAVSLHRIRAGWTQEQLARIVDVSRQTIIAIERGNYAPSTTLALKIAEALEVPIDRVFWINDEARKSVRSARPPKPEI
jgi:DNA-binding XRE family transcriptional regulator